MKDFDIRAFNLQYLLLEYARDLKISEEELIVLLMLDHILRQNPNILVTPDLLQIKLSYDLNKIDELLTKLSKRSLIKQVKAGKSLYTSLEPLHILLRDRFVSDIISVDRIDGDKNMQEVMNKVYSIFERELSRPLSTTELSKIRSWLKKYSKDDILDALYEIKNTRNKRVTISNIDKALFDRMATKDKKREGRTPLSETFDMNMHEVAEAIKVDWLDD